MSLAAELGTFSLHAGRAELPFLVRGKAHVILGEWSFINTYFTLQELEREFHGYLQAKSPSQTYLGVWSARTCSRFRRLLRERGALFKVVDALPSGLQIIAQRVA